MFFISVEAICWGALGTSILCLGINTWATRRYMHLPILLQLRDWLPGFALAAICCWVMALLLEQLPQMYALPSGLVFSLGLYIGILQVASPSILRNTGKLIHEAVFKHFSN